MVEPGTAAIATLAAVAGVSGYGAMKVNSNQDVVIEQKVHERIAQTEERLKQTQEALQAVEAIKAKQDAQLAAIQKELEILRAAKANVEEEKKPSMFKNPFTSRFFTSSPPTPAGPEPQPATPPTPEPQPAAPEPFPPAPESQPAAEPEAQSREVTDKERQDCKAKLDSLGIRSLRDYRKWMAANKDSPDIPNVNNCVDLVLKSRAGGATRKKKLRTRRGDKQKNVRRTRRS